jgi:hypothetical protein
VQGPFDLRTVPRDKIAGNHTDQHTRQSIAHRQFPEISILARHRT